MFPFDFQIKIQGQTVHFHPRIAYPISYDPLVDGYQTCFLVDPIAFWVTRWQGHTTGIVHFIFYEP